MHLVTRERGGGGGPPKHEMNIAAGGNIKQVIHRDKVDSTRWQPERTTTVNVQILNSMAYRNVTGKSPPTEPISAETYEAHNLPFFQVYEEASGIHGNFDKVKSMAEIDDRDETDVNPPVVHLGHGNAKGM